MPRTVLAELFIVFSDAALKATMFNGVYRNKDGTDWEKLLYLQSKSKVQISVVVYLLNESCSFLVVFLNVCQ